MSKPIGLRMFAVALVAGVGLVACDTADERAHTSSEPPAPTTTTPPTSSPPPSAALPSEGESTGELTVRFLDVGQGDATLLTADDVAILVDTGRHDRSDVVDALRAHRVDDLDLVVVTHPHADHIGQLDEVIGAVAVGEVWMSGSTATTATYARAMDAVERGGVGYEEPRTGDAATFGTLAVEVLHPGHLSGDAHTDTLAIRVTHGANRFLFTGDAEGTVEAALTSAGNAGATVYQVGHHGSATSSTAAFLAAVRPEVAVYSAGAGNNYGHPDPGVLGRLRDAGIEVYGTDTHGTVTITSDGTDLAVATSRSGGEDTAADVPAGASTPLGTGCADGQVDINRASAAELTGIIHIGPARAGEIEQARPFDDLAALDRVDGIGAARLHDIITEGVACA